MMLMCILRSHMLRHDYCTAVSVLPVPLDSSSGLLAPCRPPSLAGAPGWADLVGSLPCLYSSSSTLLSHSVVTPSVQGPPAQDTLHVMPLAQPKPLLVQ